MTRYAFPNPRFDDYGGLAGCIDYLLDIMEENNGRYRHSIARTDADSILFVYEGRFVGEIIVDETVDPEPSDTAHWDITQKVYITVKTPRVFARQSVSASSVGLTGIQFGKEVSNEVYADIIKRTRGFAEFPERKPAQPTTDIGDLRALALDDE